MKDELPRSVGAQYATGDQWRNKYRKIKAVWAKSLQSCPTLWDPMNHSTPGLPVPLSVSYHFAFSYCSWGSQGKNTEVVCHSLLQWTTFCQTSPPWPSHLGWPHTAWLSFIELNKAVVHVIRLASFLWLWFQCVCPLMPSRNTTILLGFLLPWTWGISSWLL